MGDDLITLAEREYQRRLAALHDTRATLAEVDAALRRLAIDRARLGDVADERARGLRTRHADLLEGARVQRAEAQAQPEPSELPPEDPGTGPPTDYVQPPFSGPL